MKKIIVFICLTLCFISCKKSSFFSNFDEIDYYRLKNESVLEDESIDFISKKVLFEDYPTALTDSLFIKNLNLNYNSKKMFSKLDITNFKNIFNSNTFTNQYTTACVPKFKDILILKKTNKIVGVVKICIECEMNYIVGKNEKEETISNSGGLEPIDLEKLIKKYK